MEISEEFLKKGLSAEAVEKNRKQFGENEITPNKKNSLWQLYLEKYKDPIIQILLIAACLSLAISYLHNDYIETIGIFIAIFLATTIGFYFEYDAQKKFNLLNVVSADVHSKVIRDGHVQLIARKDLVVGDIVLLEQGEEIPADGYLVTASSLQVNESSLTGETIVFKFTDPTHFDSEATYPSNYVLRGTTVLDGHAVFLVEKVGDATEIGKLSRLTQEESTVETPLQQQLTKLAKFIGKIGFGIALVVFVSFSCRDLFFYFQSHSLSAWSNYVDVAEIVLKYFMIAVTLLVVAVPEGLPMSVTLSLALNMKRMLKTNNLVRKMHASETMGAITTICTDKTGTLTQNKMTVQSVCLLDAEAEQLLVENIAVNSTAYLSEEDKSGIGNPTEVALLHWLDNKQLDYLALREAHVVLEQLPFSTERKLMATRVKSVALGKEVVFIKGAPEVILSYCKLSDAERTSVQVNLKHMQAQAMRTLAFAYLEVADTSFQLDDLSRHCDFKCLAYVGIVDPIREEVPEAVQSCLSAGIQVKIVTGDTFLTAREIARQIGLWDENTADSASITGPEFESLSDDEALERVQGLLIMSRARPTHKQRLVRLLQQKGEVVAVTGDGTNDAPALNFAQVGLSMGSGTAVAKEASDITLLDDSFTSIGTAVMWGRSLYRNIQRFIVFQLTINVLALLVVLLGGLGGAELPLTITQMLWVNLIMDTFAALALASIPPSKSVMREKPRNPKDFIISKHMGLSIMGTALLFLGVLLGQLVYFKSLSGGLTTYRLTYFFTFFVLLQFWNLFNVRVFGTHESAFKGLCQSKAFGLVALLVLVGQIFIVEFGGAVFRCEPLTMASWVQIIGLSSLVLRVGEISRMIKRIRKI